MSDFREQLGGGSGDSPANRVPAAGATTGSIVKASARERRGLKRHDLEGAELLRPADVERIYRIPKSTLSDLCRTTDPERRIPSYFIPGRGGRKGSRYLRRTDIEAYLEAHIAK